MRTKLEELLAATRFSMPTLSREVWPLIERHGAVAPVVPVLKQRLPDHYEKLARAILRHVFLIELVKLPAIETTKFRFRWFEQLDGDPRSGSFDECVNIAGDLLTQLAGGWLDTADNEELMKLCFEQSILPYELPLDYQDRPLGTTGPGIHRRGNLVWKSDETMLRTLKLRKYLRDPSTSPDAAFFKAALDSKIKVKTYLTDRVLTGVYKTNREKRWEVHPNSVHFASRSDCMAIEYELVEQICRFDGFPEEAQALLQERDVLPETLTVSRCPVTLEPMSYTDFREKLLNPTHGKSAFQVGHLNPLKLDEPGAAASGHTPQNISWISADGNRIQGSMSLVEVRAMLRQVASNYEATGWD